MGSFSKKAKTRSDIWSNSSEAKKRFNIWLATLCHARKAFKIVELYISGHSWSKVKQLVPTHHWVLLGDEPFHHGHPAMKRTYIWHIASLTLIRCPIQWASLIPCVINIEVIGPSYFSSRIVLYTGLTWIWKGSRPLLVVDDWRVPTSSGTTLCSNFVARLL